MSRIANRPPIAPPKRPARADGRAARRRHLELLAATLGWTSAELERQRTALDQAHAPAARADAAHAFADRLLAWSRTALEKDARPVESARLTALARLAAVVRDTKDPAVALTRALDILADAVRFESATFFRYDAEAKTLVPAATRGGHVDLIPDVAFDLGTGLSSWVARSRRPVLLSELRSEEAQEEGSTPRPGSFLSVPLLVAEDLVGVLNVGHTRPGAFTEADRDLLAAAGAVLSATLAREVALAELKRRSVTDELTGLANAPCFAARIDQEIEEVRRYGGPFSILVVSPDRWPQLVETYGADYAGSCLVSLARLLTRIVRKSDLIGRLTPGEQILVLLPRQSAEQASVAARRIRAAIDGHSFPRRRRLSVGVAAATFPDHGLHLDALLEAAVRVSDQDAA